jgi:xylulokinase
MGAAVPPVLVGLDVGTTNVKAVAVAVDGRLRAVAAEALPVLEPRPGWSEYDAEALFGAAASVIRRVVQQTGDTHVAGVSVASMAETAVPLAGDGTPLHRAVAWHDERARPQAEWWRREVGEEAVYRITGLPILPIFGIHKLMWFREHAPEAFARARSWLNVADYVAYRLCGVQATDLSLASRLMLLDLGARRWSDDLLAACGIDRALLPDLVESGQLLGGVHEGGAAATGLPLGTPVAAGGHDHPCGALALGLTDPGDVLDSMGTSESLFTVVEAPRLTSDMAAAGYQQGFHVAAGRAYCNGGLYTSGACVAWLRSLVADHESDPHAALEAWAEAAPLGARGAFFLPHLRLPSPPIVDLDARAAFIGLTAASGRGELARALLEGLAFEAQASLDGLVERTGVPARRVRAIGGGTRNGLLMRVKAALLGAPIEVAEFDEAAALGAALLAGVGAGVYRDTLDAPAHVALSFAEVPVDDAWRERYLHAYHDVYLRLYPHLKDLHHAIRDLETGALGSVHPGGATS